MESTLPQLILQRRIVPPSAIFAMSAHIDHSSDWVDVKGKRETREKRESE